MSTPLYHHLLVLNDSQIDHNELFLTEDEIEPALRQAVKDNAERWNYNDEIVEEILDTENLDDLRSALEDHDVTVYISTIEAPTPQR